MGGVRPPRAHASWRSTRGVGLALSRAGLAFAYVAAYMYEGDSPLAERRAPGL